MADRAKASDLAPLVHHVELTRAGWRTKALELMVVSSIYGADRLLSLGELCEHLNSLLDAPLGQAQIQEIVANLIEKGTVVRTESSQLKLSEDATGKLDDLHQEHGALTAEVSAAFETTFDDFESTQRPEWSDFEARFVRPLVAELGARTYEVITGDADRFGHSSTYRDFLTSWTAEFRPAIAERLSAFLNPRNSVVRSYILRQLNASFLLQSLAIEEGVFDALMERTRRQLRLTVFVDTNFLFSLIGLHENPADDVVTALNHLLEGLRERAEVHLYVLPITLEEARRTVAGYESKLEGVILDQGVIRAVLNNTTDLSGISLKYLQEGIRAGVRRLSPKEFFRPYNESMLTVARANGVELYNEDTDPLRMDQDVIDDLHAQLEFQERFRERGSKPYEVVLHDMVLWHFTARKRVKALESPLDAEYWVATIDFGLLGFDNFKRRTRESGVPICIHPTVLLQLLQLWVPRSQEFDTAIIESLQPLLPRGFDVNSERVTIKILRSLSRFENASDLSEETIRSVLLDDAVRARMGSTEDVDQEIELVTSAIVEENKRLARRAKLLKGAEEGLRRDVSARDSQISELERQFDEFKEQQAEDQDRLLQELSAERQRRELLEKRQELKIRLDAERKAKRWFWIRLGGAIAAGSLGAHLLSPSVSPYLSLRPLVVETGLQIGSVLAVLILVEWPAQQRSELKDWRILRALRGARRWLMFALATVALGLLTTCLAKQLGL